MPTQIVRTVIGGEVIETPVEVAETEAKEVAKPKKGRPKKQEKTEPTNDACGLQPPTDDTPQTCRV